ncbi:MAG: hypothetical protein LBS12_04330 [Prevotellaceae bacterium]|nr:hypothetical protein [Prevotellaceae bacterium]
MTVLFDPFVKVLQPFGRMRHAGDFTVHREAFTVHRETFARHPGIRRGLFAWQGSLPFTPAAITNG